MHHLENTNKGKKEKNVPKILDEFVDPDVETKHIQENKTKN